MQTEVKRIVRKLSSSSKAFKPTKEEFVKYHTKKLGSTRGSALTLYDELEARGWLNKEGKNIGNWKAYANKVCANTVRR